MANYWNDKTDGKRELLRLLTSDMKWLKWDDKEPASPDAPETKVIPGAKARVEETLSSALHSTNVMVLLGSGASFCAKSGIKKSIAPGMNDLWNAVKIKYGEDKFTKLSKELMKTEAQGNIELLLSLCKMSVELWNSHPSPPDKLQTLEAFISCAEKEILEKVGFVDTETDLTAHETLIRKLSRRSAEKPRVKLFTTNYDLCLEMAASRLGVPLIDGFSHTVEQRFNRDNFQYDIVRRTPHSAKAEYLDAVFHLYKLHGSVDWRRTKSDTIIRSSQPITEHLSPVLIYPRSSKYQEAFTPPYLDMFAALQAALREPDTTLIISGFGFADDHISQPIWSAIESNLSLQVILCDCGFITDYEDETGTPVSAEKLLEQEHEIDSRPFSGIYQRKLAELVRQEDTRITLLNGRFEDLVQAIPEISGRTDRQLLLQRMEQLKSGLTK